MDRETMLQSLALLRLTVEKRARRQAVLEILQEEMDDILKKKKFFEKEIVGIEKEICFILDKIDLLSLEQYVAGSNEESRYHDKMAETTEISAEDVVA